MDQIGARLVTFLRTDLGIILFNIFMSDPGTETKYAFMKFANASQWGADNREEGLIIRQGKLDCLLEGSDRNGEKFNSIKCKLKYLGSNDKAVCYITRAHRLESMEEEGTGSPGLLLYRHEP